MNESQLIDFLSSIPQYPVMGYFIADFINTRHKLRFTILFTAIIALLYAVSLPVPMLQTILMWVITFVLPLIFCRISRGRTVLYLIISILIMNLFSLAGELPILMFYSNAQDLPSTVLLSVRIIMFPLLILSWYISNRLCRKLFRMQQNDALGRYLPFLIAETIVIILDQIVNVFDLNANYIHSLLSSGILAALLFIDFMLARTVNELNQAHKTELRLQESRSLLRSQEEIYAMLRSQISSLQKIRHDTVNQLSGISYLMETGEYDKALVQLSAFRGASAQLAATRYTGNAIVDSVLNIKSGSLSETGIRLSCEGTLPDLLSLDPSVLCSVVSNLLDNAIHACEALDPDTYPAEIRFISAVRHNFLIFRCENPCLPDTKVPDPSSSDMKNQAEEHGWGIRILCQMAELYDGTADFSVDGNRFTAEIHLNLSVSPKEI